MMISYRSMCAAAVAALIAFAFVPASGAAPAQPTQRGPGRPVLHAISPTAVPGRGALIAVGGGRLAQVHSVSFGAEVVHKIDHVSATRLTLRAPKHALGRVAVTLHSASGPSRTAHLDYVRAPAPLHWHRDAGVDPRRGELTGLSCATASFCVAVEHDQNTPTRLLRFGTHSTPKTTSVPKSAHVQSVACGSKDFCVAGPATGAYVWTGSRWRGPLHLGGKKLIYGPTCARGTKTCLYYSATSTLIHKSSSWTSVPLPDGLTVTDVSCASATFCEAVAGDQFAHYGGSSWQIDASAPSDGGYEKVACAAPTYCLAAGRYSAELTGSTWTEKSVRAGILVALDCAVPHHCVGLDAKRYGPTSVGDTSVFGGWSWTYRSIPTSGVRVPALSCPAKTLCRAVDRQGRSFDLTHGRWRPRQLVPASGDLRTISCASRHWCMARDASGNALLWQDGHWSKPQLIDINHGRFARAEITCSPDQFCAAISQAYGSAHPKLIRYANGHWHRPQAMSPDIVKYNGERGPGDVSCPTAGYCVVTSYTGRLFTYDHGSWSTSPRLARHLGAIDCTSPTHCTADAGQDTLILHGHAWRRVPALTGKGEDASVVDCVEPKFCIGTAFFDLVDLHDGVWGRLAGVRAGVEDCASRTFCVAEAYSKAFDQGHPFEETFNGSAVRRSAPFHQARAIVCARGPMCIELTKNSARVGHS